jgi:hypothetical protein
MLKVVCEIYHVSSRFLQSDPSSVHERIISPETIHNNGTLETDDVLALDYPSNRLSGCQTRGNSRKLVRVSRLGDRLTTNSIRLKSDSNKDTA